MDIWHDFSMYRHGASREGSPFGVKAFSLRAIENHILGARWPLIGKGIPMRRRSILGSLLVLMLLAGLFGAVGPASPAGAATSYTWEGLTGLQITGQPAVGLDANGAYEVFARDQFGLIWQKYQIAPNGAWSGWSVFARGDLSPMYVGRYSDGRLALFWLDSGSIVYRQQTVVNNAAAWGGYTALATFGAKLLGVTNEANGDLEVFAISGGRVGRRRVIAGSSWTWMPQGGNINVQTGAVAAQANGALELLVKGWVSTPYWSGEFQWLSAQMQPNGDVWEGLGEYNLFGQGTRTDGNVALGKNSDGRLELFVVGSDNKAGHRWQTSPNGGWSDWAGLGNYGSFQPYVAAGLSAGGQLQVYAVGTNGYLFHVRQGGSYGGWTGWIWMEADVSNLRLLWLRTSGAGVTPSSSTTTAHSG